MNNGFARVKQSEDIMLGILEDDLPELDAFIHDDNVGHRAAKAFVCAALARHFALKWLYEGD
jgi:hypothetical protein